MPRISQTAKNAGQTVNAPAQEQGGLIQLATRMSPTLHRDIKIHCVTSGQSVMDFVNEACASALAAAKQTTGKRQARG